MKLSGRRVLVTGASRGIGKALAEALRAEGCTVFGAARTPGPGLLPCDVSDESQVTRLRAETGPVDVLINNAGVIHVPAPVVDIPLAEWERLFRTNLFGMVAMIRAYLPAMNASGSGAVVNLSSGWGRFAEGRQAPYCATKFGVEALTQALAEEVTPGVIVLAVNPGVIATGMLATCFEEDVSAYPAPERCAAGFVRLLRSADGSWNGRSVDVPLQ